MRTNCLLKFACDVFGQDDSVDNGNSPTNEIIEDDAAEVVTLTTLMCIDDVCQQNVPHKRSREEVDDVEGMTDKLACIDQLAVSLT